MKIAREVLFLRWSPIWNFIFSMKILLDLDDDDRRGDSEDDEEDEEDEDDGPDITMGVIVDQVTTELVLILSVSPTLASASFIDNNLQ